MAVQTPAVGQRGEYTHNGTTVVGTVVDVHGGYGGRPVVAIIRLDNDGGLLGVDAAKLVIL